MNGYGNYVTVTIISMCIGIAIGHWITRYVVKSVADEIYKNFGCYEDDEDWDIDELNDLRDK